MSVNRVNQLRQVELFSALDVDDLLAVAELAQEERHPAGAVVCRQGEPGHRFVLVEDGELRAWHVDPEGMEEEVARFGPGECFGESALMLGEAHDATIEVAKSAVLLVIDKKDLDRLLEECPAMLDDLRMAPEVERRWRAPRFDWQEPDEAVVFVLHKHDVVLLRNLLLPGILLLLVLAAFFVVGSTSMLGLLMGGFLASAPLLLALYQIVDHFNDNYILTNKRVMHDEYVYLIRQSRVGAPLTNIQSVQVTQEGAMAQMFGFGDVHIETAGEPGGRIVFQQIPDPGRMQQMILEQRERAEARTRAEERANIEEALRDRLGQGPAEEEGADGEEAGDSSEEGTEASWPVWMVAPMRVVRYFFPALREEEGDTITWRKHWVALLRPIALPSVAILLVTLVVAGLLVREEGDRGSILLSYFILLVFLVPWWLWVFEDWQNELYQVTSTRIIDIERLPFGLREERREASLGMIQNVNLRVPGVIGRLFGYGSVTIETAGSGAFTFDYVKDPQAVQTEIFRRMAAFTERKRQEEARRRRDELLDWFTVYDEMRNEEAGGGEGFAPGGARGGSSSR